MKFELAADLEKQQNNSRRVKNGDIRQTWKT